MEPKKTQNQKTSGKAALLSQSQKLKDLSVYANIINGCEKLWWDKGLGGTFVK